MLINHINSGTYLCDLEKLFSSSEPNAYINKTWVMMRSIPHWHNHKMKGQHGVSWKHFLAMNLHSVNASYYRNENLILDIISCSKTAGRMESVISKLRKYCYKGSLIWFICRFHYNLSFYHQLRNSSPFFPLFSISTVSVIYNQDKWNIIRKNELFTQKGASAVP